MGLVQFHGPGPYQTQPRGLTAAPRKRDGSAKDRRPEASPYCCAALNRSDAGVAPVAGAVIGRSVDVGADEMRSGRDYGFFTRV